MKHISIKGDSSLLNLRFKPHRVLAATILLILICTSPGSADARNNKEKEALKGAPLKPNGNIFASIKAELERNRQKLYMEKEAKPYYLAVNLSEREYKSLGATLGALTGKWQRKSRYVQTSIRVGSYEKDNTGYYGIYPRSQSATVPFEDNDLAVKRGIFFAFDRAYKQALKSYSQKKAYLRNHPRKDLPPDWSKTPVISQENMGSSLQLDPEKWLPVVKEASAVFKKHPVIQTSGVAVALSDRRDYLLTTEGQKYFASGSMAVFSIHARGQADDGTYLSTSWKKELTPHDTPPRPEKIIEAAKKTAQRLLSLLKAPKFENSYSGPVIFEGQAAVQFVLATIAPALTGNAPPVTWSRKGLFENQKGRRILPAWVDVTDNPGLTRFGKKRLVGHYTVDEEGVKAKKVALVKKGRLLDFVSSRRPSKDTSSSNGHGRGLFGALSVVAAPSNLIIKTRKKINRKALKKRLLRLLKNKGLEHGYIVRKTSSVGASFSMFSYTRNMRLPHPIEIYRVDRKGKETLVRGARLEPMPISELERIVAMGGGPEVGNIILRPEFGVSVITPDILLERVEISEMNQSPPRKPLLPSPLLVNK